MKQNRNEHVLHVCIRWRGRASQLYYTSTTPTILAWYAERMHSNKAEFKTDYLWKSVLDKFGFNTNSLDLPRIKTTNTIPEFHAFAIEKHIYLSMLELPALQKIRCSMNQNYVDSGAENAAAMTNVGDVLIPQYCAGLKSDYNMRCIFHIISCAVSSDWWFLREKSW